MWIVSRAKTWRWTTMRCAALLPLWESRLQRPLAQFASGSLVRRRGQPYARLLFHALWRLEESYVLTLEGWKAGWLASIHPHLVRFWSASASWWYYWRREYPGSGIVGVLQPETPLTTDGCDDMHSWAGDERHSNLCICHLVAELCGLPRMEFCQVTTYH
ncbi:hypothetical protein IWZ01DRAFT_273959 [Phyllosticta capitalensis]